MPSVCSCLSHIYIVFYSKEVISSHVIWKGLVWRENKPHCHVVLHLFCGMLKREKKIILSYTVRNILNYHHKLDNDVKKMWFFDQNNSCSNLNCGYKKMPDVPSRWENRLIRIRDVANLRGHRTGRVVLGTPIYLYGPSPVHGRW